MIKNRKNEFKEWIEHGMCGMLPIYGSYGSNETLVLFEGKGPKKDRRKIRTIVIEIMKIYQKDIGLVRKDTREIMGQRTMNPLFVTADIILVPFKVRKPIGKDDGATGYIFYKSIKEIDEEDGKRNVVLKDGKKIIVMERLVTAQKRLRCALQLYEMMHYASDLENMSLEWKAMCDTYNEPATRGDIAMLARDIRNLIKKLEKK